MIDSGIDNENSSIHWPQAPMLDYAPRHLRLASCEDQNSGRDRRPGRRISAKTLCLTLIEESHNPRYLFQFHPWGGTSSTFTLLRYCSSRKQMYLYILLRVLPYLSLAMDFLTTLTGWTGTPSICNRGYFCPRLQQTSILEYIDQAPSTEFLLVASYRGEDSAIRQLFIQLASLSQSTTRENEKVWRVGKSQYVSKVWHHRTIGLFFLLA